MEFLIVLLLISHGVVLYILRKDILEYKKNNKIFMHRELETIHNSFDIGVREIAKTVDRIQYSSQSSLKLMEVNNNQFALEYKQKFQDLNKFIKSDYTSLTTLLANNNELLSKLLKETETNITQNEALKPALINSHDELQKVYGKIKQVVTSSEKHLKDVKDEIANSLDEIRINAESKVKQLAAQGEKNLNDSVKSNMEVITDISSVTNATLKTLLSENHISQLTSKVKELDKNIQVNLDNLQIKNEEFSSKVEILLTKIEEGSKKNRWGL